MKTAGTVVVAGLAAVVAGGLSRGSDPPRCWTWTKSAQPRLSK